MNRPFLLVLLLLVAAFFPVKYAVQAVYAAHLRHTLKKDLAFVHETIVRDSADYHYRAELRTIEAKAYADALREMERCSDSIDYRRTVAHYFAAFHDLHVRVNFEFRDVFEKLRSGDFFLYWPRVTGVQIARYNDAYYVRGVYAKSAAAGIVKPGDKLLGCKDASGNFQAVDAMLEKEIFTITPALPVTADYYRNAPKLFQRWDKKTGEITECSFSREDRRYDTTLVWFREPSNYNQWQNRLPHVWKAQAYVSQKRSWGHWLKLPDLGDNGSNMRFEEQAARFRKDKIIVLDIRGNTGGSDRPVFVWLRNFFGSDSRAAHRAGAVFALASNDNIKWLEGFGEENAFVSYLKEHPGELVDINPSGPASKTESREKFNYKGKIYLLTDYWNYSAALTLIERFRSMQGVLQVGVASNANSMSGEIRCVNAPSGHFQFTVPIKVFPGNTNYKPFEPDIPLRYDPEAEIAGKDSLALALEKLIEADLAAKTRR